MAQKRKGKLPKTGRTPKSTNWSSFFDPIVEYLPRTDRERDPRPQPLPHTVDGYTNHGGYGSRAGQY